MNKTLGEIDSTNVFGRYADSNKGLAGDVIEQSVLGYPPDTRQYPDIVVDGEDVEVKTTGVRVASSGQLEAKEPMSITAVSMDRLWAEEFESSTFWHKLVHLLVVYYHYEGKSKVPTSEWSNFEVLAWAWQSWTEEERAIFKSDWSIVRDFVREIMESIDNDSERRSFWPLISTKLNPQLMFLDTAPKYPNNPRFRLKRTVVTGMWRKARKQTLERLSDAFSSYAEFDGRMHQMTVDYGGRTLGDLADELGYTGTRKTKQLAEALVVRMFGGTASKLNKIELFASMGLVAKSIVVTRAGTRTEDTKLWGIDFEELEDDNVTWDESTFRANFAERQLLFIMFEEPSPEAPLTENRLLGFKRISFAESFIETDVRYVWDEIRRLIFTRTLKSVICRDKNGNPIINPKSKTVKQAPNFPKSQERLADGTRIDHSVFVRGTAGDASHKSQVVAGVEMLHQDIWLKGSWVVRELARHDFL